MILQKTGWARYNQWVTAHIYKGFHIVEYTVGGMAYVIYKDNIPYSALHFTSIEVACKIIDKHLDKQLN